MISHFKFKSILLLFVFIFNFSCLRQNSGILSTNSSNYYFLAHRGQDSRGNVLQGTTIPIAERFFTNTPRNMFKMNFKKFVYGNDNDNDECSTVDEDEDDSFKSADLTRIKCDIKKLASELDSNSTFLWMYDAHGSSNGEFFAGEMVKATDILDAIKEGRKGKNTPFKRFIILAYSCYSDQFIFKFQQALSKLTEPLFEEGIYFASSNTTNPTQLNYSYEMILPVMFILRDQQFIACNSKDRVSRNYEQSYQEIQDQFLQKQFPLGNFKKFLEQIIANDTSITNKEEALKKLIEGDNPNLNKKNPTFNDITVITQKMWNFGKDETSSPFTMNISFTEGNNIKNTSTSPIFTPIDGCN